MLRVITRQAEVNWRESDSGEGFNDKVQGRSGTKDFKRTFQPVALKDSGVCSLPKCSTRINAETENLLILEISEFITKSNF